MSRQERECVRERGGEDAGIEVAQGGEEGDLTQIGSLTAAAAAAE